MRKPLLVWISLCICLISCDPENESDDDSTWEFDTPVCTGFAYRDTNNTYLRSIGVPNNKLTTDSDKEWVLRVYPIPTLRNIQIEFDKPGRKTAWITAAEVVSELCENPILSQKPATKVGSRALAFGVTTGEKLTLEIPSLPNGPYRLYLRYNGELFWENIIITDSNIF